MSTTVDNRVVKMTFDNKSFEKGVDDTLKTIDKLNKKLEFKDASDGFDQISKAANQVDFKKLETNIQTLSDRFSGLGIIGMQIWTKIGDAAWDMITGPFRKVESAISNTINTIENKIVQGGWNRALNLDQAENMIKNLGYAWDSTGTEMAKVWDINNKKWKESTNIYKYVDKAVSGTAYSLDEAAVATGNLLPTLTKLGDIGPQVTDTLRAIMGVASTYSKDFNQISNYFQKVATKGSLGRDVASYMTQIGIEVYDTMQQYLGLSSEQLDEALEDGLISFEMFRDAYLDKFGDSLDKANDTYKGAISNMNSAFGRVGAKFAMPIVDYLIEGANAVRIFTNAVNEELDPFIKFALEDMSSFGKRILNTFVIFKAGEDGIERVSGLTEKGAATARHIAKAFEVFRLTLKSVFKILGMFGEAISRVFFKDGANAGKFLDKLYVSLNKFIKMLDKNHDFIVEGISGFLYLLKAVLTVVKILLPIALKAVGIAIKIATALTLLVGKIITTIVESRIFKKIVETITKAVNFFISVIKKAIKQVTNFIKSLNLVEKAGDFLVKAWDVVAEVFTKVGEIIVKAFKKAVYGIKEFNEKYHPVTVALDAIKKGFEFVYDAVTNAIDKIAEFIGTKVELPSLEDVKSKLVEFGEKVKWAFTHPKESAELLLEKLVEIGNFIKGGFKEAVDTIVKQTGKFTEWLGGFKKGFDDSKKSMEEFADSDAIDKAEKKLSVMKSLSTAMGGIATAFERMWETFKTVGKRVVEGLQWVVDELGDFLDIHSVKDLIAMLASLVKIVVGYNWSKAGAGIGSFFFTLSQSIRSGLGTNVSLLKTLPEALLKIAEAIAILGAVVIALGAMNADAIEQAKDMIGYIMVLSAAMVLAVKYLGAYRMHAKAALDITTSKGGTIKMSNPFASRLISFFEGTLGTSMQLAAASAFISSIGAAILEVVVALAILANALKDKDGEIDWDSIAKVLTVIAGVLVGLGIMIAVLNKATTLFMSHTDKSFKGLDQKKSAGFFKKFFKKSAVSQNDIVDIAKQGGTAGRIAATALFVMGIGAALIGMATATAVLSLVPKDQLENGIDALLGLMFVLTMMMGALLLVTRSFEKSSSASASISQMAKGGQLLGLAAFITSVATALLAMTPILIVLGSLPTEKVVQGVGALSVMAIAMGIAAWLAGQAKTGFKAMTSVIGVATALIEISGALVKLANAYSDDADGMGAAIGVMVLMSIIMGIIISLAKSVDNALSTAILIASFGASLYAIALAFEKVSDASPEFGEIIMFVVMMALLMGLMVGLGALVGKFPALEGGMLAVSGALLMLGGGIFLVAAGLQMLAPLMDSIYEDKDRFAQQLSAFAEVCAMALVGFFVYFLDALAAETINLINSIGTLLLNIVVGIVNFLAANATTIGVAIGHFFAACGIIIVTAIVAFLVDLWIVIKDWLGDIDWGGVFKAIGKAIWKALKFVLEPVYKVLSTIIIALGAFLFEGTKSVLGYIKKIAVDILEVLKAIVKPIVAVFESIVGVITGKLSIADAIKKIGKSIGDAFAAGIRLAIDAVTGAVDALIKPFDKASDKLSDFLIKVNDAGPKFEAKDTKAAKVSEQLSKDILNSSDYKKALANLQKEEQALSNFVKRDYVAKTKEVEDRNIITRYDSSGKPIYFKRKTTVYESRLRDINDQLNNLVSTGKAKDLDAAIKMIKGTDKIYYANYLKLISEIKSAEKDLQTAVGDVFDFYEENNKDIANRLYATINGSIIRGDAHSQIGVAAGAALGKNVIKGLNDGLNNTHVTDEYLKKFIAAAKATLGIASPSKLFKWIGQMIMAGFGIGIDDGTSSVNEIFATALNGIEDLAENAAITPVFDLSEIQNEADTAANTMAEMKTNIPQDVDLLNNTNAAKIDTLGESVDGLSSSMSTAMLEKIITDQNGIIMKLSDKLNQMGVYIDGKTLVGSVITDIDKGLGTRVGQIGRSVIG